MRVFLTIFSAIPVVLMILYIVNIFRVWLYERQINKVCDTRDKEIQQIKSFGTSGITIGFVEGSIKVEREKWQAKLDELERKRRFILDKLPLMRK